MAKETDAQKETIGRVMHEFKHGELETRAGEKVSSKRQAVAIALSEGGASKYNDKATNKKNLHKSKEKESRGETGQQEREGKAHVGAGNRGKTKTELLGQARERKIPGRSKMTKPELEKALNHNS